MTMATLYRRRRAALRRDWTGGAPPHERHKYFYDPCRACHLAFDLLWIYDPLNTVIGDE